MRVFLGLNEVAGLMSTLASGLREIGVDAKFHDIGGNPFAYGRGARRSPRRRLLLLQQAPAGTARWRAWNLLLGVHRTRKALVSLVVLATAVFRYDAFILEGRDLFLGGRGLWLLRVMRKRIIVVFLGSDHRPPYLDGTWMSEAAEFGYRWIARSARRTRARVARAERYADVIVALPASSQFHVRPFVDLLSIGICIEARERPAANPDLFDDRMAVRILHCPTHPLSKGTSRIRTTIERLRNEGLRVEYRELTGEPHSAVLDAIEWADLVIDQVFSDTPMAGLATEASWAARPTVVGSYAADLYEARGTNLPTLLCSPDSMDVAVRELATNASFRAEVGTNAFDFVRSSWTTTAVAQRFVMLLSGKYPAEWTVSGDTFRYTRGYGMDEAVLRSGIRELVRAHGIAALQLDERPDVRMALEEFADEGDHVASSGRNSRI